MEFFGSLTAISDEWCQTWIGYQVFVVEVGYGTKKAPGYSGMKNIKTAPVDRI